MKYVRSCGSSSDFSSFRQGLDQFQGILELTHGVGHAAGGLSQTVCEQPVVATISIGHHLAAVVGQELGRPPPFPVPVA